jgi:hypothetical protein
MAVIGLLAVSLPLLAGVVSLILIAYRPARGPGWALLALVGSAMMLAIPSAYMAITESGMSVVDGWVQVTLALGASGLVLLVYSARRKVGAARRRPPGRCPGCNYDRAGLREGSPCPECGHAGGR